MKAFMCLALATVASAAPQFLGHHGVAHHGVVGHHAAVHAPVLPTAVSGSVAPVNYGANKPVNGYGHGQVSHQSVSKPYQGEHRSTTQSKAFGAHAAVVADAPNRLHGADAVVSHGVHAVHAPLAHHGVAHHGVAHAVHAPVVAHAVHAAPAYHAPVVHAAPAYHAPAPAYKAEAYPDEVSPYTFTYAVADDYSKSSFNAEEQSDGASNVAGGYSVALPDGRIQHVKYTSNAYDGYVADVTYEGTAVYPEAPAPGYHAAPAPAYHAPVAHAGYAADDLSEVSPYSYTYAVADDYSGAAFNQAENNDGAGVVDGEYSVNLPDGRIQHVKYHANDYDGYVADVTYEGEPHYAAAPVVAHAAPAYHAPAPAYHAAPVVAHAVHAPVVAHAVHAPVVAHAGHGLVHGGLAHHGVATTVVG